MSALSFQEKQALAREEAQTIEGLREKARMKTETAKVLGVAWEEPPPLARRSPLETRYGAALDLLLQFPNEWAMIAALDGRQSAANSATSLGKKPIRSGRWEYRGVRTETGSKLYARYLGPEGGPERDQDG